MFYQSKKISTALYSISRAKYYSIMRLLDDFFNTVKIQAL